MWLEVMNIVIKGNQNKYKYCLQLQGLNFFDHNIIYLDINDIL